MSRATAFWLWTSLALIGGLDAAESSFSEKCHRSIVQLRDDQRQLYLSQALPKNLLRLEWKGSQDFFDLAWLDGDSGFSFDGPQPLMDSPIVKLGLEILNSENGEIRIRRALDLAMPIGSGFYFDMRRFRPVIALGQELFRGMKPENFVFGVATIGHEIGHLVYWYQLKMNYFREHRLGGLKAWRLSNRLEHLKQTEERAVHYEVEVARLFDPLEEHLMLTGKVRASALTYPQMASMVSGIQSLRNIPMKDIRWAPVFRSMEQAIFSLLDIRVRAMRRIYFILERLEEKISAKKLDRELAINSLRELSDEYWRIMRDDLLDVIALSYGGIGRYTRLEAFVISHLKTIFDHCFARVRAVYSDLIVEVSPPLSEVNRRINRFVKNELQYIGTLVPE